MATDRELLAEAKEHLKKQNDLLESLSEEALLLGSVIAKTDNNKLVVTTGGDPLIVNALAGAQPGDTVWLLGATKQILKKGPAFGLGQIVDVRAVHDTGVEIEVNGRVMLASAGQTKPGKGDRVMLDASGSVVLSVVFKNEKPALVPTVTPVYWDDIGGNKEAKLRISEAIELPYKHPKIYSAYGKNPPKGILLWGPPGCIDGEAEVQIHRAGKGFKLKLKDLVERFNNPSFGGAGKRRSYGWDAAIPTMARCLVNGEFRLRRILGAHPKGVKDVLKLTLSDGKTLRLTPDHEILTQDGVWVCAENLQKGDLVLVNGKTATRAKKHARWLDRKGYWWIAPGLREHPFFGGQTLRSYDMLEHRLVMEASLNNMTLDEWIAHIRDGKLGGGRIYTFLTQKDQVHHKDGDSTNNTVDNLEIMTQSEHSIEHEFHKNIPIFLPKAVAVELVERDGQAEVFDITVEDGHNFTANGIVVHNCGKTLLGKAIATSIGSTGGFISVKGPELLDPYVGVAESNVRALFRHAEKWKATSGKAAVIFIDEADALLAARGRAHNYMGQTIVPMFLTEMQGIEESGAMVILATNRPDILDPAVLRDGRVDAKIQIPRPDKDDAKEILAIHIDGKPVMKECGNRILMSEIVADVLYDGAPDLPYSGALLEGLVAKASDYAIRRDLKSNVRNPSGLSLEDFKSAVVDVLKQEELTTASGG